MREKNWLEARIQVVSSGMTMGQVRSATSSLHTSGRGPSRPEGRGGYTVSLLESETHDLCVNRFSAATLALSCDRETCGPFRRVHMTKVGCASIKRVTKPSQACQKSPPCRFVEKGKHTEDCRGVDGAQDKSEPWTLRWERGVLMCHT